MERYHSIENHLAAARGEETPWVREYAPRGTFDWRTITHVDADRYVVHPAETRYDPEYILNGYIWSHGFQLGKNDMSRTFIAPRDGLVYVEGIGEISFFYFNANSSCLRFMHNDRVIWPAAGEYEEDFFPIGYEHNSIFPAQFVQVKKGDKLRFIGRNRGDGQVDDVQWVVAINYLPATFLNRELTLKIGESLKPEIYNETDKTPLFVSDNEEVVHVDTDGTLTALAAGPSIIHAHFGAEVSSELLVWVGDGENIQNPMDLDISFATPYASVGCGLGVQTDDTLQLALQLGQATASVGNVVGDAKRFDDAADGVTLMADGFHAAEVDCTFLPDYQGGRTLKDVTVVMYTTKEVGKLYHMELWYNTTKNPEEFRFLYAYRVPGLTAHDVYPSIRISGFDGRVTDVETVRVIFRSVEGYAVILKEIDINFEDDGAEIGALRTQLQEQIWVPSVFSDKMMIQRDKPVRVWGFGGKEGDFVTVSLEQDTAQAEIKNGKWLCELPARPASTDGETLTVTYRDQTFTYGDIWFGDLWWAGGQSNMEVVVGAEPEEEQARFRAGLSPDDKIRFFKQRQCAADEPRLDVNQGKWHDLTVDNYRMFSAVAANFICELYRQTKIPVAILYGAIGASKLEAWLPATEFGEDEYSKRFTSWFNRRQYDGEIWYRPIGPFHQMVEPMTDFNMTGLIWYQGEGNSRDERDYPYYAERLHHMVDYWGKRFRVEKMPFVAAQLAPLSMAEDSVYGWCCIREAILNASLEYENMEAAFIGDTADETHDCHPPNKDVVGIRMAHRMLETVYGIPGVHQGPVPNTIKKEGNAFVIGFDYAGDGLVANDGEPLRHFGLSADGKKFFPAKAEIVNDTVVVSCDEVKEPVMVQYAFKAVPKVNFFNKNGFVATPFRMTLDGLYHEPKA